MGCCGNKNSNEYNNTNNLKLNSQIKTNNGEGNNIVKYGVGSNAINKHSVFGKPSIPKTLFKK